MKKFNCIVFLYCSVSSFCFGQQKTNLKNNALSVELGKVGLIYNAVFTHTIQNKNYGYKINAGSNFSTYQKLLQTGVGAFYVKGKKNNFAELGLDLNYLNYYEVSDDQRGFNLLLLKKYTNTIYTNLNVGYQYNDNNKICRIGISPGVLNLGIIVGGYISFGIKF